MFSISRSYEGFQKLATDDLLTAVKISLNNEADLYQDGRLLVSWMGFEMEHNVEILNKHGIVGFIVDGCWKFKYADESRNNGHIFAVIFEYQWGEDNCVQVQVHDYRSSESELEFDNLEQLFEHVIAVFLPRIEPNNIHITDYRIRCESHKIAEYIAKKAS